MKKLTFLLLCLFFGGIVCCFAALNICKSCGYENDEDAVKCHHCSHKFPPKLSAEHVENDLETTSEPRKDDLVTKEVRLGNRYFKYRKYEIARLYFRNALAMEAINDPEGGSKRSQHILMMVKRSQKAARVVARKCPRCAGTGKGKVTFSGLKTSAPGMGGSGTANSSTFNKASGKSCKKCGGTGKVNKMGTINDMKYQMGQARQKYNDLQLARKYVPLGSAWLPPDMGTELSLKEKAVIMRVVAPPCEKCAGFGRVDCSKCAGEGILKCSAKGCKDGRVEVKKSSSSRGKTTLSQVNATKRCPECRGKGIEVCVKCKGDGTMLCRDCGGSGEREQCAKCTGAGFNNCRRCGGSGIYRGKDCTTCNKSGVTICSSCNGEGRK